MRRFLVFVTVIAVSVIAILAAIPPECAHALPAGCRDCVTVARRGSCKDTSAGGLRCKIVLGEGCVTEGACIPF